MKYLIIDNGQAFFCFEDDTSIRKPIDQITQEDLLKLVNLSLAESFEMDSFDDKMLKNAAHKIIYKNIYQKLDNLRTQRERFEDERSAMYLKAIATYSVELAEDMAT